MKTGRRGDVGTKRGMIKNVEIETRPDRQCRMIYELLSGIND